MKCDICGADPMTANCNNANCDTGKPDPVSDMFEEMGIKVVDVTPKGQSVTETPNTLPTDTDELRELLKSVDKSITTRTMREPLADDAYIVEMRGRLEDAVLDELQTRIQSHIDKAVRVARAQLKVNVWTRFKMAMAAQDLSPRPIEGARFRTPLEELTLILEREVPINELTKELPNEQAG